MYRMDRFKRNKEYLKYILPYARIIHDPAIVLRKANASVVFATQSLADIVESPIFSTVLEESLKEKYFMFGLNQRQVEIIAGAIKIAIQTAKIITLQEKIPPNRSEGILFVFCYRPPTFP